VSVNNLPVSAAGRYKFKFLFYMIRFLFSRLAITRDRLTTVKQAHEVTANSRQHEGHVTYTLRAGAPLLAGAALAECELVEGDGVAFSSASSFKSPLVNLALPTTHKLKVIKADNWAIGVKADNWAIVL
jgi:hypothetical protein